MGRRTNSSDCLLSLILKSTCKLENQLKQLVMCKQNDQMVSWIKCGCGEQMEGDRIGQLDWRLQMIWQSTYINNINSYIMRTFILAALTVAVVFSKIELLDQQAIIEEVNSIKGAAWKAGHNHYWDGKTMDEIKGLMGVLETPKEAKLPEKDITPLESVNDEFDSRTAWPNCESIKEVRDQSNCGSCWAFGAAEAMSDRICIASGQKVQTRISSQNLLTCCGFSCGQGCNGGYPEAAWSYFKNTGLVSGWLYNTSNWCQPYSLPPCDHHVSGKYPNCSGDSATPKCVKSCQSSFSTPYADDIHKASSVYSLPNNVAKIQSEIQAHGPVEAAFTVYNDFLAYKSGVYHHVSGAALGGHAIKILGWGTEGGLDYWLVANSWNEDWGDKGFFKIKRGSNECGIEQSIVAGLPVVKAELLTE